MKNTSKISALESKFPILAIENDCLLSKEADITIGFSVQLPELFYSFRRRLSAVAFTLV
ncbi:DUF3875 domain-containing protein [Capnocytophaga canimorsus]|nr:DUF3875 domain-containing protein [Capnocytophaga canimorsus]WGU67960.1 DUF3875 domain-containing protein [Capnocytophaga canimorsus]WGU70939.1 DUF3875 domain-containing protein [Capnocytophaga canimorsus]